jgi:hypothetical protein
MLHKEKPSMLDVHPPHESAHTWKDFFIHIATICVGLLIAIGLEQSVDALHRQHDRVQLRDSLQTECAQIASDAVTSSSILVHREQWIHGRIAQLQTALWQHQPPAAADPVTGPKVLLRPDDPLWRSAKTSGLVTLLSEPEVSAYSELERLTNKIDVGYDRMVSAHDRRLGFQHEMPYINGAPDFSHASPEDLRKYLSMLTEEEMTINYIDLLVAQTRGADRAVLARNFDLRQIQSLENAPAEPETH